LSQSVIRVGTGWLMSSDEDEHLSAQLYPKNAKLESDHLVVHRLGHPPVDILHGELIGVRAIRPD
jgi:hypothetical protein